MTFNLQERLLLRKEILGYFSHRRSLHFLPLLILGVFLMAWSYPVASPLAPVIVVVIAGLESQFNNIFYRTENELEAMALFPLPWERIILIKNLATILFAVGFTVLAAMFLLYFSPDRMSSERYEQSILYLSTVIFPLLHFGNSQSLNRPRKVTGLQTGDLIETVWLLVNLALVSLPYYLFVAILHLPILSLAYAGVGGWAWYARSIRRTARRVEAAIPKICSELK